MMLVLAAACQPQAPPDTRAADEQAVREADSAFSKVAAAKDLERTVAYYTDDASVLPPNGPMATGSEAIKKFWSEMIAMPGLALSWQPTRVEVSRGGDLGYTVGTYQMTANDPQGQPVTDRGKYTTIWRKQADGSWKVAVDMFDSDTPPPPSAQK